jgi:ribonuclease P protein component
MKYGRWANGRFLDLKYLELAKNRDYFPLKEDPVKFQEQLRVAFTVGLKISKKAVERNRVRRQMREVVRLFMKDDKLKNGYYLLFVAKKEILGKEYLEIAKEMGMLLRRSGVVG